ncbi:maleylpyruvate isomerase family mycothiol-dependent enzyme [Nocardioides fonticola]|uniref:Maleylpyruvate isomerase family mycothiol-dependent enzyme n=1 Tax=Nocardioides fonticola TaxID=450363 RepID=A0ABP7XJH8_9ACTN
MRSPTDADLAAAVDAFTAAVAGSDPAAAVAGCPGWSVTDLVHHVAEVHQWCAHAVVAGTPDGVPETPPSDLDAAGLASWYAGHAAHLRQVLAEAGTDGPAWTFGSGPHTAGWWLRRQTHEVLVHTWDVVTAAGADADAVLAPDLAWDGVEEIASMFYPRQVRLGRTEPLPVTLVLTATDLPGADAVRLGEGPEHRVEGSAVDLLLTLWRRRPPTDPVVAEALTRAVTP